jgi:4'-phosphopantetheinyl transferase
MPQEPSWPAALAMPALSSHQVHLWRFGVDDLEQAARERLWNILSEEERARADRFRFAIHRNRFIASRGILRDILARYTNQAPEDLCVAYGSWGKPYIVNRQSPSELKFNLSHSGALALLAVCQHLELGVDLERIDEETPFEQIATRLFSSGENTALRECPVARRRELFFQFWTRKEAYVKACGVGLSKELGDFEVLLPPGISTVCAGCWLCDVSISAGYACTLVVSGKPCEILQLNFDPSLLSA